MKTLKALGLITGITFTGIASANTCGELVANSFTKLGDYAIALSKHNGKPLNFPNSGFSTSEIGSSGFIALKLAAGTHEFTGYAVCTTGSCEKSRILGGSDADLVSFSLDVQPGKSYKIMAKPAEQRSLIPGKRFDVFVSAMQDISCAVEAPQALPKESKYSLAEANFT